MSDIDKHREAILSILVENYGQDCNYDALMQIEALLSTAVREAEGCVDCKKRRCENCERLWAT